MSTLVLEWQVQAERPQQWELSIARSSVDVWNGALSSINLLNTPDGSKNFKFRADMSQTKLKPHMTTDFDGEGKGQEAQDNFITAGIPVTIVAAAERWSSRYHRYFAYVRHEQQSALHQVLWPQSCIAFGAPTSLPPFHWNDFSVLVSASFSGESLSRTFALCWLAGQCLWVCPCQCPLNLLHQRVRVVIPWIHHVTGEDSFGKPQLLHSSPTASLSKGRQWSHVLLQCSCCLTERITATPTLTASTSSTTSQSTTNINVNNITSVNIINTDVVHINMIKIANSTHIIQLINSSIKTSSTASISV